MHLNHKQFSNFKFIIFISALIYCFLFITFSKVHAQVPDPTVPCDEVSPNDPLVPGYNPLKPIRTQDEFHSLRPYQKNITCTSQIDNYAKYCGSDLTLKDTVTKTYPGDGDCTTTGDTVNCNFVANVSKKVAINLDNANLPIMGNTEKVINSQNPINGSVDTTETLNDADKMNGYVSWYLNGTLNRAEYPFLDTSVASAEKLVDYSGPLNKLLPQDVQFANRSATVKQAGVTRHDQVVGCSIDIAPSLLGIPGMIFKLGEVHLIDLPIPCYTKGLLDFLETASSVKKEHRLSEWSAAGNLPPLISDYPKYSDYLAAYKRWRGYACANITIPTKLPILGTPIPIIGGQTILLCVDDVFKSKFNSYLFQDIPLSSTEDVAGQIKIDSVSSATNEATAGVTVKSVKFSNQTPSTLFFSHMEESNQLGSLLQDTYTPKGIDQVGSPTNIAAETDCKSVEVRSNAGDNLFANQLTGTLSYTASFSCQFKVETEPLDCTCIGGIYVGQRCGTLIDKKCTSQTNQAGQTMVPVTQSCSKDVYITLSTSSSTPEVDNIWSRLVAGPMAVFKRIFPKTNTEGSVGQIIDIAGSTNISYSGENIDTTYTDLKLPHIGGISEYFLKGIQTALRPKGFGDTIEFATNSENSCKSSKVPTLPTAQGACKLKSTILPSTTSLQMPTTLKNIIEAAAQTYNVPSGLIVGVMYGEGLFDGSNKKNWTEENVKSWATCAKVPGCSETGDDNFMGFNGNDWDSPKKAILSDLKKLDPTKTEADRCNLLDAIYGVAWNLHDNADGGGGLPATCFGIALKASVPGSCSWTPEQYESAIKVSESGYTSACLTAEGSCRGGGGLAAACPSGDTCETVGARYPDPANNASHNACIWDMAHKY